MRSLLIFIVLVLTGLTFYSALGFKSQAIEDDITTRASAAVSDAGANGIDIDVDGRHVTLSGLVANDAEETAYLDAADATHGALGPIDGLIQREGAGFLTAQKDAQGITLRGSVSSDEERAALLDLAANATDGTVTDALTLGAGTSDWRDAARFGLGEMAGLTSGTLMATPDALSLTGTAPGDVSDLTARFDAEGGWSTSFMTSDIPEDLSGELAALTENLAVRDANITRLEDDLDAQTGLLQGAEAEIGTLTGLLLERDLTIEGLEGQIGDLTLQVETLEDQIGDGTDTGDQLAAALAALADREAALAGLSTDLADRDSTISGLTTDLADRDSTIASLTADLSSAEAEITRLSALQGSTDTDDRVAALQGEITDLTGQIADRDATIATLQNRPSFAVQAAEQCSRQAEAVLEGARINFASATADIEDDSVELLERLTGIALACVGENLTVEIGGHTDSQGGEEGNQTLSEARAAAVVAFMTDRGVPVAGLNAVGYGETLPIADNETEEGRAANRRISFEWQAQ